PISAACEGDGWFGVIVHVPAPWRASSPLFAIQPSGCYSRREMKIRRFAFSLLAVSFTTVVLAQRSPSLSPKEQAIVAFINANEQASNDLLAKLVNINSGTHNLEGVRAVADIMREQLTGLGFDVQWIPMPQVGRAGVLVAEHRCPEPGKCGKRMLLIGHMDTVFEKSSPFQTWSVNGNIATGPGVNDMKGGLIDML